MPLIPAFEIGLWNAWWFMIIYPLQWLVVLMLPKHIIAKRTRHSAEILQTRRDRIMSLLTQAFWVGATLYSIFLPFQTGSAWLWTGLIFFTAGLTILILASVTVAKTRPDQPFTTGIYRFSRHPMYFSMLLVYLAASIATASWLFLLITVITFFLQDYQARQEEGYCIDTLGKAYTEYMRRTPRWIGVPT